MKRRWILIPVALGAAGVAAVFAMQREPARREAPAMAALPQLAQVAAVAEAAPGEMRVAVTDRITAHVPRAPGQPKTTVGDFARALRIPSLLSVAGQDTPTRNILRTPEELEKERTVAALPGNALKGQSRLDRKMERRVEKQERRVLQAYRKAGQPLQEGEQAGQFGRQRHLAQQASPKNGAPSHEAIPSSDGVAAKP